jgi:hypothetical protein
MSLVSATRIVGGLREYAYRGFQQLPLVIGSTSLLFTITTGSIAHANLALGMGLLMPAYTYTLQLLISFIMNRYFPGSIFWKSSAGDTCNIIPGSTKAGSLDFLRKTNIDGSVPSYWMSSIAFFIGYSISNAVDSLKTPANPGSNEANYEKRNTHAVTVIITTIIFSLFILLARFIYMSGCEGTGLGGITLSVLSGIGAGLLGYGMYDLSKRCGARSSDLFGILSQILPPSATSPKPIVCTAS